MRIRQTLKRAAAAGATILAATTIYLVGAGSHTPAALAQSDAATPTPSPTASRPPATTGIGISVMNPQPDGGYYAAGDVIQFKVPMAVGTRLRPIVVTQAISDGTSFQFRYSDNPDHGGYAAQTANLAAIVDQGTGQPQYLIYEHTVQEDVSTNAAGTVYYATETNRYLYKVHDAVCGPTKDNCRNLLFTQPAGNNPPISGTVRVAAAGAWNYAGRSGDKPTTSLSKVRLVDPPADGVYTVGDTVRLQAEYDKRLNPTANGSGGDNLQIRVSHNNAELPINEEHLTFRTANLHSVYNAGDKGYAEYRYTVLEKDQDPNGIQINEFTKSASQTKLCPEVIGAGCNSNATVENSAGRHLLENVKLNGKGISWSNVLRLTSMDLVMGQFAAARTVAAAVPTPSGSHFIRPLYYKASGLPPGMEITQSGDSVSIGGTPTASGTFPAVITAIDGTGQKAAHTVNIMVTTPDAPAFTAARNDLVVYQDDATQGNQDGDSGNVLTLPAVSGGTQPVTYSLHSIADGQNPSPDTCPNPNSRALPTSWITQPTASGAKEPGTVSVKSGSYPTLRSVNLVLKATDASNRSACWHFSASVAQRATLGTPEIVGNETRYFAGDKIAFDVPVTNGPVTVAQGAGKAQPQLQIQIGNTGNAEIAHINGVATYVNAGGSESNPHQGSKLRFEYTLANGESAHTSEDLGGQGFVKATGMTQRENVTDANGHVVGGNPGVANILGKQQRIDSEARPEFDAAPYTHTKWRDETFAIKLENAHSGITPRFRVKHGANTLPATAPADVSNAPYGLHFNPGTRELSWPDNQPNDGDNLSVTLTYEVYLPARTYGTPPAFNYNYPEYVADTATVTVTRKERPVPTAVHVLTFRNTGGDQGTRQEDKSLPTETLQPGDRVEVRVIYDAPVAFAADTTDRPTVNLTVGKSTRLVTLNTIATRGDTTNNSAEGSYTLAAADQGAIGIPDAYLNDNHLLVGASAAPAAKQGNPVRPTLPSDVKPSGNINTVAQSGGPTFSVGSDHTVTLYGTVDASVVLPEATSPTDKTLTYTLRQNYPNSPNLGSTAEASTGLKFDAATRTLSRDKGEVIAAVISPTVYILTATESGDGDKSVRLNIGVNLLNQPEATVVQPFFHPKDTTSDTLKGDMAAGDTLLLNVNFNKNVKIKDDEDSPAPKIRIQIGDSVREAPLSYWTRTVGGERINAHQLRGIYTVDAADHDHDGITLASDWLVNSESVVGTDAAGQTHATYENPVRYASVTDLKLSNGQITVQKAFGWPDTVAKPALTIVTNREYQSSANNLGNTLPAANAAGHTSGIGYRSTTLPAGLADILHVKADGTPQLVGFHTDPDRSEHGVTTEHTVTATVKSSAPAISDTLEFSIRIISDVLLDGTANRYTTRDKIRVIVNHNAVVDFTGAATQPTLTLSIGGTTRTAAYNANESNPANGRHIFEYTVVAADRNTDGTCAVTGMTNGGGIAPIIPDGGIALANCHVNRAGPSFASNAATETVYVAKERGGYAPLPQATGGVAPVTYALVNEGDGAEIWGRTDLTLATNDDGSHGANIPAIPTGSTPGNGVDYEKAQYSKLVATDALGNATEYKFTVTTVQNVPEAKTTEVSDPPTGRDFFHVDDEIVVTVDYGSDKRIAATERGAYVELTVGDATRRAYAQAQTAEFNQANGRYVKFSYTVQAGDADTNGITVGNVIHDCDGLTGHFTDSAFDNGLGKPSARMHQMVDGCPIPTVATPSTTEVRTARDPSLDLDRDDDGLIEIRNANQLIAMSLDPNGNGIPMESGQDYKANANFDGVFGPDPRPYAYIKPDGSVDTDENDQPAPLQDADGNNLRLHEKFYYAEFPRPTDAASQPDGTTNGCPESRCTGYELASDIDLRQVLGALRTNDSERRRNGILGDNYEKLLAHGMGNHHVPWQTTLEGNGHVISNLIIGTDNARGIGFLTDIGKNGTVRNLGFANASVHGESNVGVVTGTNGGTIHNVFVSDGRVSITDAGSSTGLIAGMNGSGAAPQATISRFWATGTVTAGSAHGSVAGDNFGQISEGWTDAYTDGKLPIRLGYRGENIVTGYTDSSGSVTKTREVHGTDEEDPDNHHAAYLITVDNLVEATAASQAPYAAGDLSADAWDYGDNCQRPVLSSGGHLANRQSGGQGATCASSGQ